MLFLKILFVPTFLLLSYQAYNAEAAEISYEKSNRIYQVRLDGEIKEGDLERLKKTLVEIRGLAEIDFKNKFDATKKMNPQHFKKLKDNHGPINGVVEIKLSLNSNGGDVIEAMNIGRLVRNTLIKTSTGQYYTLNSPTRFDVCLSACFFIFMSGVERNYNPSYSNRRKQSIGIHRPYFLPKYYKGLSSDIAKKEYNRLTKTSENFLKEIEVPDMYFEEMFKIPSNEMYMLSDAEAMSLNGKTAYYDELLISRCGFISAKEKEDLTRCSLVPVIKKDINFKLSWLSKQSREEILRNCQDFSDGYIDYLIVKDEKVRRCRIIESGKEQCNRLNEV